MGPRAAQPHPQMPASYPRPDQSRPTHPNSWRSILTLTSHLHFPLPNGLSLRSPHQTLGTDVSCPPYTPHAHLSHYSWFDHPNISVRSINNVAHNYASFLGPNIFLDTLCLCSLPQCEGLLQNNMNWTQHQFLWQKCYTDKQLKVDGAQNVLPIKIITTNHHLYVCIWHLYVC